MQKTVSLEYGEYYHIYHRGNNRDNIFFEEKNFEYFLKLYVKYIVPVADTYAYCLMNSFFSTDKDSGGTDTRSNARKTELRRF